MDDFEDRWRGTTVPRPSNPVTYTRLPPQSQAPQWSTIRAQNTLHQTNLIACMLLPVHPWSNSSLFSRWAVLTPSFSDASMAAIVWPVAQSRFRRTLRKIYEQTNLNVAGLKNVFLAKSHMVWYFDLGSSPCTIDTTHNYYPYQGMGGGRTSFSYTIATFPVCCARGQPQCIRGREENSRRLWQNMSDILKS